MGNQIIDLMDECIINARQIFLNHFPKNEVNIDNEKKHKEIMQIAFKLFDASIELISNNKTERDITKL